MAIAPTTGAKVYIGPTTAASTASAYAALAYKEIKNVETIGGFGDTASVIEFTSLGDARVRKRKGVRNAGDMTITVANDPLDQGQRAVVAAEATEFPYAFKVVLADGADSNDTDSTFYFHALVGGVPLSDLSANEIVKRAFSLLIDSPIIEVPSTAVSGS
ncbi:phage tail tube protein [uncultured Brevundimonas sp.]|uniref:phage tail tube protein n=1 Tax=uncultured Brevundimonas sp. TaxID=213418 RepID=UPI002610A148|nr:phage tail tube protein [uncultured Brevundimonas sp.]